MNKSRLEAFSDGVFAIAITILILNISITDVPAYQLTSALQELLPKIYSYVISFLLIGLYWIGHHFYFERIKQVDGNFVWLNIMLLMFISFLPFPTFLVGKYPHQQLPLMLYGVTLIATNVISYLMLLYVYKNKHLANANFKDEFFKEQKPVFIYINVIYLIGIVFTYYNTFVSYILYLLVLVLSITSYVKRMNSYVKK